MFIMAPAFRAERAGLNDRHPAAGRAGREGERDGLPWLWRGTGAKEVVAAINDRGLGALAPTESGRSNQGRRCGAHGMAAVGPYRKERD